MATANEVRINVVADTRQAETSLKRVGNRFEQGTPQVKKMQGAFTGLNKAMGLLGIGAISAGVALRGVVGATGEAAKATANLGLITGRLPSELKVAFEQAEPSFDRLSKKYGVLKDDVALAMGILLQESRDASVGIPELEGVLGRVALGMGDVESEATLVAGAIKGQIGPIKEITGLFTDLDSGLEDNAEAGAAAVTVFDKMGVSLATMAREGGGAFDALSRNDYREALSEFIGLLEATIALRNQFPFQWIIDQLNPVNGTIRSTMSVWENFKQSLGQSNLIPDVIKRKIEPPKKPILSGSQIFDPEGILTPSMMRERSTSIQGTIQPPNTILGPPSPKGFRGSIPLPRFGSGGEIPVPSDRGIRPFAHGGIVRRPTVAMIGEAGPEAVVPLNNAGGVGGTTVIIQGDAIIDDDIRMGKLVDAIDRRLDIKRRRGI